MIVIADDFTGAAEIAGICLEYGIRAVVCLDELVLTDAEVHIVTVDSRSREKSVALQLTDQLTRQIANRGHQRIFKKIDSVLRGYIREELAIQMPLLRFEKCMILPANPSLGRRVVQGRYMIGDTPLDKTDFALDPEFPAKSAAVDTLLGAMGIPHLQRGQLPRPGLNTADILDPDDLRHWVTVAGADCLLAGSGDCFDAVLSLTRKKQPASLTATPAMPHLYVCGTGFAASRQRIGSRALPYAVLLGQELLSQELSSTSLEQATTILQRDRKLIIGFEASPEIEASTAARHRIQMADYTRHNLQHHQIEGLLIEGGATAAAVFHAMGWKLFTPKKLWQRGVVGMQTGNYTVTVKPGSYPMPEPIRALYELER
ncbi:hypothetical protein GCM10027051_24430 [Niabella terrae]